MGKAWAVVITASGMVNAKIIAGRLEAEGIPTRLNYDVAGSLYGVTVDGLGAVKIMVLADDLGRANEVLSQSYEGMEGED